MGKRNRHIKNFAMPGLIHKIQTGGQPLTQNQPEDAKVSAMLQEIIEPYRRDANNFSEYRKLVTLAIIAWNIANIPLDQMLTSLDHHLDQLPRMTATEREDLRQITLDLVQRKIKLYPEVQHPIVNFEITQTQNKYHLAIASKPE